MNDANWDDEAPLPKKRGIPKWIFFCGCGCLLVVIALALLTYLGIDKIKDLREPDAQLPVLQSALAFDPLPPELQFVMAIPIPMNLFVFQDTRGYIVNFTVTNGGDREEMRRTVLNPEFGGAGMAQRRNAVAAELTVQGRELTGLRCTQDMDAMFTKVAREGASVVLDLTPEDGTRTVFVQITRTGGAEPISDEEVRTILEPFHVGPER